MSNRHSLARFLLACGQVESAAEESLGGVLLPESAKSKPVSGEVVAHGPGKVKKDGTLKPTRVKSGQRVVYFK